uniref:Probable cytosol aminopeptidase n=1 Tax=uncultured Acidobacteriota bacterium TaxID=171953 RepID=H5SFV6_9BACT|nr:leucyl aminopeptidase [uncultured Acidobacteriota bacterium]
MRIKPDFRKFFEVDVEALCVSLFEEDTLEDDLLRELDRRLRGVLASALASGEVKGKFGETFYVPTMGALAASRVLFVGAGKRSDFTTDTIRRVAGTAARFLRQRGIRSMALLRRSSLDLRTSAQAAVEGVLLALFDPGTYKTQEKEERTIEEVRLVAEGESEAELQWGIERGTVLAKATNFARNLVNEPASVLTPVELARRAQDMAARYGLDIEVLDEHRMKELGMGALLGVARGSDEPARLIVLRYVPEGDEALLSRLPTIALLGKGITFDSGGISLKPAEGMEQMKYDMAGGAAVLGAMRAIAQLRPRIKVLGLVPATENMPSGRAQKPGDVVRTLSGKTVEVINTDAEGRLILADTITYARRLGAQKIVDLATLTGACVVALGSVYAAIFGNDAALVEQLIAAGREAGEKLWPMPLDPEYREQLKSEIADLKNVGGRKAGAITAAYFLKEFAEETPWAHVDIAGTAWLDEQKPYVASGPTGMGVRTLAHFVCRSAEGESSDRR